MLLSPNLLAGGLTTSEPDSFLLNVFGFIYDKDVKIKEATVTLYDGNRIVKTIQTKKNGKFLFQLNRNRDYTIEIKKDTYVTKRVSISTKVPHGVGWLPDFDFDTSLLKVEKFRGIDISDLDFPSALIAYDTKDKEMDFSKTYSKLYRAQVRELLLQARSR
ncbi:MAG: hypothetical protein ACFB10_06870 [Salibacteraceae bacterium]